MKRSYADVFVRQTNKCDEELVATRGTNNTSGEHFFHQTEAKCKHNETFSFSSKRILSLSSI